MEGNAGAAAAAGGAGIISIIYLVVIILMIAAMWKVFSKAGRPGWGAIIPFYNVYLYLTIAGKPGWWLILCFVPIVNIVIAILANIGLAQKFGKGGGFAAGLILLPIVFLPILGFGSAQYQGGEAAATEAPTEQAPPPPPPEEPPAQ